MYYSMRHGVQPSWRNRIDQWTKQIRHHRYLPAFVGIATIFWVSLLVFGLRIAAPADSATPAKSAKAESSQNVSHKGLAASSPKPSSSSSTNTVQSNTAASTPVTAATDPTSASTSVSANDQSISVGGRGADAAAVEANVTPPSTSDDDTGGVNIGITVNNPLAQDSDPLLDVGASTQDGVQVDVGL